MDTTTNGAKPRKARETKSVLILMKVEKSNGVYATYLDRAFQSTADAEKWVRTQGQDGTTYSIVTLHRTMTCTVATETKTVRKFS
jgi:hypothetical protein